MSVRRVLAWGAAAALGILSIPLAIALLAWRQPNHLTLPSPTGPYAVGRVTADWRDHDRIHPFAPTSGTHRELPVWIWYPAEKTPTAPRVEYMPPRVREAMTPTPAPARPRRDAVW
jgi:hypothetical protein